MTRLMLGFNIHSSEPYEIGDGPGQYTIDDVIEREAENVLSEANADHLEAPTDECYDALRASVIVDATAALTDGHGNVRIGSEYRDPIGVLWRVIETEE